VRVYQLALPVATDDDSNATCIRKMLAYTTRNLVVDRSRASAGKCSGVVQACHSSQMQSRLYAMLYKLSDSATEQPSRLPALA
jgi:hypothetical protein